MTPLVFAVLPMLVERSPTVCSNTRKKGNAFSHTGPVQVAPNDVGPYYCGNLPLRLNRLRKVCKRTPDSPRLPAEKRLEQADPDRASFPLTQPFPPCKIF